MRQLIAGLRWVLRLLMTERARVHPIEKVIRGALMVPVFGAILVLVRAAAALGRPLEMEAITRDGLRFRCQPHDFIQMYLYLFGVWEPDVTAYVRERLRGAAAREKGEGGGAVFVDVGANIGYDTLVASRALAGGAGGGAAGSVVAIEASPLVYRDLLSSIERNGAANVRALNVAAAARRGTLTVYGGPRHNTGLTTTVAARGLPVQAEIEAAPLGDLLLQDELARVSLIKIDVEGGEDAVLEGIRACLDRLPRDVEIVVELSPAWWSDRAQRPQDVLQPFFERGFTALEIANNYWPWRYLWPNDVQPPRALRADLERRVKRIDVVLSRHA